MTTFDESLDAHEGFSTDDVRIFSADSANTGVFSSASEAWEFRAFIAYMTKRDLRTTYTRSYLGWAWSLLNAIAEVIIYSSSSASCWTPRGPFQMHPTDSTPFHTFSFPG